MTVTFPALRRYSARIPAESALAVISASRSAMRMAEGSSCFRLLKLDVKCTSALSPNAPLVQPP